MAAVELRLAENGFFELLVFTVGVALQLSLPYVLDVCIQLASGVQHLHACGVLHRDLKTDNALVQAVAPLVVKWADFGISVKLSSADSVYGGGEPGRDLRCSSSPPQRRAGTDAMRGTRRRR